MDRWNPPMMSPAAGKAEFMDHEMQKSAMQQFAVRWTQAQPSVAACITALVTSFHDTEDILQRVAATRVCSSVPSISNKSK